MLDDEGPALNRVNAVQQHYSQTKKDIQMLEALVSALSNIDERVQALQAYYQTHWRDDVDAMRKDITALKAHEQTVEQGEYSVLGEDTLWNTLEEYRDAKKALLQLMAQLV